MENKYIYVHIYTHTCDDNERNAVFFFSTVEGNCVSKRHNVETQANMLISCWAAKVQQILSEMLQIY